MATKVTEKLTEPPKFPLTRGLTVSLALARHRRTFAFQSRVCELDSR